MTIQNPAPLVEFVGLLPIQSVAWRLHEPVEVSRTAGGRVLTSLIGAPMWAADINLVPMTLGDARHVRAIMRRIGATGKFLLYNPEAPFPLNDPTGSILGASDVKISQVTAGQVRLQGLPSGYRLYWGDMFSVVYAGRRALFEVAGDVTANGIGTTPLFDINPPAKVGMAAGNNCDLKQASAQVMFATYDPGVSEPVIASGLTFQAIETL